jgi:salicylate 5-hydroxylase large subunit
MTEHTMQFQREPLWNSEGSSRIPYGAYTNDELHRRELQRLFYSGELVLRRP